MTTPSDTARALGAGPDAEQDLLARLRSRDDQAFELVVRRYGGQLLATARRLLGNEEDARDALQESFAAVFRAITTFEGKSQLGTWLHRVVVNTALMRLRSRRCRPECAIEDLLPRFQEDGHHLDPPCPRSNLAERELLREEDRALVRDAIGRLPANHREVILLRDIEQMSTEETGRLLGITTNAVKIRLHRARQALRTLLERSFEDRT